MTNLYKKRVEYNYNSAQDRMIKNKQAGLKDSINRSYFGFKVTKPDISTTIKYNVLINRNDEDEQIISAPFESDFQVGTVVHWLKTNTYWLVHEQNVNEIAYFEGKMIECKNFQIVAGDEKFSVWGRIVLSSKTGEGTFDKTLIITDETTLQLWIPNTEASKEVFRLNTKFSILDTFWEVKTVDFISKNGILILTADRTADIQTDYKISENNIVNDNTYIDGPNIIHPLEKVTYIAKDGIEGSWSISDNKNIQKIINDNGSITLIWTNSRKRNDFTISFGDYSKEIHVASLM